jgi:hypothetical protein
MIEEFFLPDRTMAVEEHVDPPGRGTLNRMHDLGQAEVSIRPHSAGDSTKDGHDPA